MTTALFAPDMVECSLAGVMIDGWADGEFISVTFDSNDYEDVVGTGGDVGVAKVIDNRVTVTLKLLQTSAANDRLSAMRQAGRESSNGDFAGAFSMRDSSGTSILQGVGWIQKMPDQSFDRTITSREWTLRVIASDVTIGGGAVVG